MPVLMGAHGYFPRCCYMHYIYLPKSKEPMACLVSKMRSVIYHHPAFGTRPDWHYSQSSLWYLQCQWCPCRPRWLPAVQTRMNDAGELFRPLTVTTSVLNRTFRDPPPHPSAFPVTA